MSSDVHNTLILIAEHAALEEYRLTAYTHTIKAIQHDMDRYESEMQTTRIAIERQLESWIRLSDRSLFAYHSAMKIAQHIFDATAGPQASHDVAEEIVAQAARNICDRMRAINDVFDLSARGGDADNSFYLISDEKLIPLRDTAAAAYRAEGGSTPADF